MLYVPPQNVLIMENRFLTVAQLRHACENNPYLILREGSGSYAINSKIAPIALKRKAYKDSDATTVIGFSPCSFHEYISRKIALIG